MKKLILLSFVSVSFLACDEEVYTPKPKGYFRIDLPEKKYELYSDNCPFSFEKPVYSSISRNPNYSNQCWFNLDFKSLQATVYFSYEPINNNLDTFLENSRTLAFKHTVKATDIEQIPLLFPEKKVFGLVYDIKGDAASEYQFHITDSTTHFLRGSLYFNTVPNQDSIAPALDFVKKDIEHLFQTFQWKKS
ncbi:MAG: gliding motility lipoprotein GldD [Flavobacteriales bacterium]|nr:gliding motility lipoprotein GldD [Flavobacteriales bacterium]